MPSAITRKSAADWTSKTDNKEHSKRPVKTIDMPLPVLLDSPARPRVHSFDSYVRIVSELASKLPNREVILKKRLAERRPAQTPFEYTR